MSDEKFEVQGQRCDEVRFGNNAEGFIAVQLASVAMSVTPGPKALQGVAYLVVDLFGARRMREELDKIIDAAERAVSRVQ
jgi:hypothetical protein